MKHLHMSFCNRFVHSSVAILLGAFCNAQVPQTFSYQAVARDAGGLVVPNAPVGVQFQVHAQAANGPVAYAESHTPTTNAQGLFQANVGQGTPTTGTFTAIDWNDGVFFVEVGLDPAGGTAYTTIGVQQLLSVPFALQADNAATSDTSAFATAALNALNSDTAHYAMSSGPAGTALGEMRYWNGTAWVSLAPGSTGSQLNFCNNGPQWGACPAQELLDAGYTPCQAVASGVPLDSLWGKTYLGGLIAYLDPNTCQGIVAAPNDVGHRWMWWDIVPINNPPCHETLIGASSTALFTGITNTALILAHPCSSLSGAEYLQTSLGTEWSMPSLSELQVLYTNLHLNGLGGFYGTGSTIDHFYFSSTESSPDQAYYLDFSNGNQSTRWKQADPLKIRGVKYF